MTTRPKPNDIDSNTAKGAAATDTKPFTPQAQGVRGLSLLARIASPEGKSHPMK